jgi:hypothetical protein
MGDTSDFYRVFMAPGMAHCSGGDGPNAFGNGTSNGPVIDADHDLGEGARAVGRAGNRSFAHHRNALRQQRREPGRRLSSDRSVRSLSVPSTREAIRTTPRASRA